MRVYSSVRSGPHCISCALVVRAHANASVFVGEERSAVYFLCVGGDCISRGYSSSRYCFCLFAVVDTEALSWGLLLG
jgi:hypothetical protein